VEGAFAPLEFFGFEVSSFFFHFLRLLNSLLLNPKVLMLLFFLLSRQSHWGQGK